MFNRFEIATIKKKTNIFFFFPNFPLFFLFMSILCFFFFFPFLPDNKECARPPSSADETGKEGAPRGERVNEQALLTAVRTRFFLLPAPASAPCPFPSLFPETPFPHPAVFPAITLYSPSSPTLIPLRLPLFPPLLPSSFVLPPLLQPLPFFSLFVVCLFPFFPRGPTLPPPSPFYCCVAISVGPLPLSFFSLFPRGRHFFNGIFSPDPLPPFPFFFFPSEDGYVLPVFRQDYCEARYIAYSSFGHFFVFFSIVAFEVFTEGRLVLRVLLFLTSGTL